MPQLKCVKPLGVQPSTTDRSVINAFLEIQKNSDDIRTELEPLYFIAAKEVKVPGGKTAIVIFVPYRQINSYKKLQARLIREFEKKFSGKHVVIIGQRKIIRKPTKTNRTKHQKVPRSRTVTAVNEAVLDDLVYPTDIVAKRLRVRLDGSRLLKVFLNRNDQSSVEYKLDTFAHVYHKLTGRNVQFVFPAKETAKVFSFKKKQRMPSEQKNEFGMACKAAYQTPAEGVVVKKSSRKLSATSLQKKKTALAQKKIKAQNQRAHLNAKRSAVRRLENHKKSEVLAKQLKKERKEAKKKEIEAQLLAWKNAKKAGKTAKSAKSAKAAKSAKSAKSAKAAEPVKAAKPAKAAKSVKAAEPVKAAKPAKVAEPVKTAKPAKAAKTAKAAKAAKGKK